MWAEHFKNYGYHTARVSKIFHMGVPGGVEYKKENLPPEHESYNGADDAACWTENFNTPGPEWKAEGDGETLQKNPDGKRPVVGGNTFVVVEADGDDLVHADGKAAQKAAELIKEHKDKRFWLDVGFVRTHGYAYIQYEEDASKGADFDEAGLQVIFFLHFQKNQINL